MEEQKIKEEQDKEKQKKMTQLYCRFHNQEEITREMLQALVEKITVYT